MQRWGCGLACQLDSILQQQADTVAEKLFGVGYAQSMMAQSLQELMQLLPDEVVYANLSQKEVSIPCLLYVTFAVIYGISNCIGMCRS